MKRGAGRDSSAGADSPRLAVIIALCIASCLLIYAAERFSGGKIRADREARRMALLQSVITQEYDNDPLRDRVAITSAAWGGEERVLFAHRTRKGGVVNGFVAYPVPARGYNGVIALLVGVAADGRVTGARVLRHRETEGLGDRVHQGRSDWLEGFRGASLGGVPGLGVEGISGATVSSGGVVEAVEILLREYWRERGVFLGGSGP